MRRIDSLLCYVLKTIEKFEISATRRAIQYVINYVVSLNSKSISVEVRIYVVLRSYDVLKLNSKCNCRINVINCMDISAIVVVSTGLFYYVQVVALCTVSKMFH